ncbi:DUF3603 domain-containing protein [Halalkalibacillus sediminis]|uniref:DUF3603 domain-containing protein n=1 Tax=Halalkalibacillus sediminis TaxID=2018042 RepID=A0A2I0QVG9_9BACI|nr:DUF3603 family protein [Halalkalibacillus sediminis]PKR78342.1 DUF3603 domain-containing protein [Halalkalibacillus sediminis]
MMYVHDIWVNWFEGEENGYNVCHFHEWRKTDSIELLDQVPVAHIKPNLFDYIENDMQEIPKRLLDSVYQRAYLKKNHKRVPLDYSFVMTDGEHTLVIDTLGYEIPVRKSRLVPRQERLVLDLVKGKTPTSFSLPLRKQKKKHHLLSLQPVFMVGLTRKERHLKHLMMLMLDQLEQNQRIDELRYWLTEWKPEAYEHIQQMSFKEGFQILIEEIKLGWGQRHEDICYKMAKGQPFFERLWEMEHHTKNMIKK